MAGAQHHVSLRGISHVFQDGGRRALTALTDVALDVAWGQFVSIIGPSGCGKSTLLRIVAGLLRPTGGEAEIAGAAPAPAPPPRQRPPPPRDRPRRPRPASALAGGTAGADRPDGVPLLLPAPTLR